MKILLKKLLKDSIFHKAKITYLILALFIAFFGISTTYFAKFMVEKDFEQNYAKSDPAHIILTWQSAKKFDKGILLNHASIKEVEERPMSSAEIQIREDKFMRALIIGVEDIQNPKVNKFSTLVYEKDYQVYIEQNGSVFFDKAYLEDISLVTKQNGKIKLGKSGLLHDTRLPPSRMEHLIYVFLPLAIFEEHFPPESRRILIHTNQDKNNKEKLMRIGKELTDQIEHQLGIKTLVSIPSQEHPHQNIADGIFYLVKLLGGSLALIGSVFMVLILLIWLYPQIPDMGTLKSIGFTHKSIQYAYLLFILFLGILASTVGISLGYVAAKAFNAFIAFTQNFIPVANPIESQQFLLLILFCLGIPIIFASLPISKAVNKSTRHAQNMVFSSPEGPIYKLNQLLSTAKSKYIGNNLLQNLSLFLLSSLLITTGLAISFTGYNLISSLNEEMNKLEKENVFDYALLFNQAYQEKIAGGELPKGIKSLNYVYNESMSIYNPQLNIPMRLTSARITKDVEIPASRMILGEWKQDCEDCLYFAQNYTQDLMKLKPGEKIRVMGEEGSKRSLIFGGILKLPEGSASVLRPIKSLDKWNSLYLQSEGKQDLSESIRNYVSQKGKDKAKLLSASQTRQIITDHLEGSFFIISLLGIMASLFAIVGLIFLINLNLLKRTRDIGILKSIGADSQQIKFLFEREILLILLTAIVAAGISSLYLSQSMCFYFGDMVLGFPLLLKLNWPFITISLVVFLLITLVSIRYQLNKKLASKSRILLG